MQPNYPPQYAPQPAPQWATAPAAEYPPVQAPPGYPVAPQQYGAPQGYPAPAPQQYGYPVAPAYGHAPQPGQPYGPPVQQYPGYPQQQPPAPAQPTVTGSLDGFYGQPSGASGPSFKFKDANGLPQIGKTYAGVVARPLTDTDVRQSTDPTSGALHFDRSGNPKWIMIVPMLVQQGQEFPEGTAGWWVKGDSRDKLVAAMSAAGAPEGPPEAGAYITVTLVGTRPVPNMSPKYIYQVTYTRPGAGSVAPATHAQAAPQAQPTHVPGMEGQPIQALNIGATVTPPAQYAPQAAPVQQYVPQAQAQYAPQQQPQYAPQPAPQAQQQYVPQQPAPVQQQPQYAPQPAPQYAPVAAPPLQPAPNGLDPVQQQLMATLTGAQA